MSKLKKVYTCVVKTVGKKSDGLFIRPGAECEVVKWEKKRVKVKLPSELYHSGNTKPIWLESGEWQKNPLNENELIEILSKQNESELRIVVISEPVKASNGTQWPAGTKLIVRQTPCASQRAHVSPFEQPEVFVTCCSSSFISEEKYEQKLKEEREERELERQESIKQEQQKVDKDLKEQVEQVVKYTGNIDQLQEYNLPGLAAVLNSNYISCAKVILGVKQACGFFQISYRSYVSAMKNKNFKSEYDHLLTCIEYLFGHNLLKPTLMFVAKTEPSISFLFEGADAPFEAPIQDESEEDSKPESEPEVDETEENTHLVSFEEQKKALENLKLDKTLSNLESYDLPLLVLAIEAEKNCCVKTLVQYLKYAIAFIDADDKSALKQIFNGLNKSCMLNFLEQLFARPRLFKSLIYYSALKGHTWADNLISDLTNPPFIIPAKMIEKEDIPEDVKVYHLDLTAIDIAEFVNACTKSNLTRIDANFAFNIVFKNNSGLSFRADELPMSVEDALYFGTMVEQLVYRDRFLFWLRVLAFGHTQEYLNQDYGFAQHLFKKITGKSPKPYAYSAQSLLS